MFLRVLPFLLVACPALFAAEPALMRVPNGGVKPSVALDRAGVLHLFHAQLPGGKGEADRAVFVAQSADRGATFAEEKNVLPSPTGACGCCALTARITAEGGLAILFRAAEKGTQRGMHLLLSRAGTRSFKDTRAAPWIGMTCPGSSPAILPGNDALTLAWENPDSGRVVLSSLALGSAANREAGQGFPRLGSGGADQSLNAGPSGDGQKHPVLAVNERGETLLAWTEGTGWNRGGALAWEIVSPRGERLTNGKLDGAVPPHGSLAAFTRPDGSFVIMH